MAETELFGYGPGAFEGARAEGKLGLLELTAGGTLFLDGVGEMSPRLQVKLLRFLQDGCFRRVGSDEEVYLDVRVICATQVDLSELCARGEFRQDLYHRLNVLSLHIPPLRECLDGLAPLVEHFLDQASRQIGCPLPKLAPAAMERLSHYHWPGNVRQLENVLFQAVSLCEGGTVKAEHIRLPDYGVRQPLGDFRWKVVGRDRRALRKAVLERLYSEHPSSRQLGKRLGFRTPPSPISCAIIRLAKTTNDPVARELVVVLAGRPLPPSGITPPVFRLSIQTSAPAQSPSPLFAGSCRQKKLVCKLLMAHQYSGGRQTSGMQRKECGQVPLCGNDRRQPECTGAKGPCQQPGEHFHQRFPARPGAGAFDAGVR
jgi:hypothetical protein